jgi:septal ring factor EnvC (AmiA/AmiB activator)
VLILKTYNKTALLLFFLGMVSIPISLNSQNSRRALEQKRLRVQREIAENQRILKSTQKEKSETLSQLSTIKLIIEQRSELIDNLQQDLLQTDNEIQRQTIQLQILQQQYEAEKLQLHQTVKKAYKTRKSGQELAFVFSSDNMKQAFRRWKYLKKVSEHRNNQIENLKAQAQAVELALENLGVVKFRKKILISTKESEKKQLEVDKNSKQVLVNNLSKKEKELAEKIRQKERQMAKLNAAISRAIAREIEAERKRKERLKAREASSSTNKSSSKSSTTSSSKSSGNVNAMTPEARSLSESFSSNRGILPWPVERGYITQTFGVHPHPEFKNITLQNNGIDIATSKGANAKCVFKGTVSAILSIPGEGQAVLVNHGEYFTVYSRLEDVFVQKGEQISTGTSVGRIMQDEEGKYTLQFQLWEGQEKQNPQTWLKRR